MIREARPSDLEAMVNIENRCFKGDRLSRRNLGRIVRRGNATVLVDEEEGRIRGYSLVLFRSGTSLCRLYSLAVDPDFRGLGVGLNLLEAAEADALENECVIMRLEVRADNLPAISLYKKRGYRQFSIIPDYYEDHSEALRLERNLVPHLRPDLVRVPFYRQTLAFTCGPAALIMAMKALEPGIEADRKLEMRIWRESTTIFMTSGHGGCSPFGLALSAYRRGFDVEIYVNDRNALFLGSVRDPNKKEVIQLVHEDQMEDIAGSTIKVHHGTLNIDEIRRKLSRGSIPIVLISSYRIYHEKTPHWIVVTGSDDRYIYVHDSFVDTKGGRTDLDSINLPILIKDFEIMSRYG
ncbi:MAG: GNAT family N-acetyltransferase/peptidase C39 family protein, partial [bacterium]